MILLITLHDIAQGQRKTCCGCPIALAVLRTQPSAVRAEVLCEVARIWYTNGRMAKYTLPRRALHWIDDFESRRNVRPTSFVLEPRARWVEKPRCPRRYKGVTQ